MEDFITASKPYADIVIGNPPYVRTKNIDRNRLINYIEASQSMTMGTDLYIGFIEHALTSLKENGKVCFICSDRWMQNGFGKKIRNVIREKYSLDCVIRMEGVNCFESLVSAYPAIFAISNGPKKDNVFFAECNQKLSERDMPEVVSDYKLTQQHSENHYFSSLIESKNIFPNETWCFETKDKLSIIIDIEKRNLSYKQADIEIGIGIATGKQSVFIVESNPGIEPSRMMPTVLTKDIRNGKMPDRPIHWIVNPWDENGKLVSLSNYPKLKTYFYGNYNELIKRHIAITHPKDWYRTIDRLKAGLLTTPKLLIPELSAKSEPILDSGQYYPSHSFYYLSSRTWDLTVLGGLLLSDLVNIFISSKGVKMRGQTLRFQAQYLRMI